MGSCNPTSPARLTLDRRRGPPRKERRIRSSPLAIGVACLGLTLCTPAESPTRIGSITPVGYAYDLVSDRTFVWLIGPDRAQRYDERGKVLETIPAPSIGGIRMELFGGVVADGTLWLTFNPPEEETESPPPNMGGILNGSDASGTRVIRLPGGVGGVVHHGRYLWAPVHIEGRNQLPRRSSGVARIDPRTGEVELINVGPARAIQDFILAHGALWIAVWPDAGPAVSTVERIDPASGKTTFRLALDQQVRALGSDDRYVFAALGSGAVERIDPASDPPRALPASSTLYRTVLLRRHSVEWRFSIPNPFSSRPNRLMWTRNSGGSGRVELPVDTIVDVAPAQALWVLGTRDAQTYMIRIDTP